MVLVNGVDEVVTYRKPYFIAAATVFFPVSRSNLEMSMMGRLMV